MSNARPNLLFIMSDDHAAHAISAYGSGMFGNYPMVEHREVPGEAGEVMIDTDETCGAAGGVFFVVDPAT